MSSKKNEIGVSEFVRGYACAVAALINMEGQVCAQCKDLYNAGLGNLTENDMINKRVDAEDIAVFKKFNLIK